MTSRLLMIAVIAACTSARTNVRWTYVEDVVPIESVTVFSKIQSDVYYGLMQRGLEQRMKSGLAACRVHAEFHRGMPDRDGAAEDQAGITPARPNARLTVMPWGGTVVIQTNRYGEHQDSHSDVSFKLEVFDYRVNKVTWRAVVDFEAGTTPDQADGESFAAAILSRLRRDGVLACG